MSFYVHYECRISCGSCCVALSPYRPKFFTDVTGRQQSSCISLSVCLLWIVVQLVCIKIYLHSWLTKFLTLEKSKLDIWKYMYILATIDQFHVNNLVCWLFTLFTFVIEQSFKDNIVPFFFHMFNILHYAWLM